MRVCKCEKEKKKDTPGRTETIVIKKVRKDTKNRDRIEDEERRK